MNRLWTVIIVLGVLSSCPSYAQEPIRTAVAANFIEPFNEIAGIFEVSNHVRVEPVFTSTGKLYAQIVNGAPFDVFLSADEQRPRELFDRGLADKPFVYARGQAVLWTVRKELCASPDWKVLVTRRDVKLIAIVNTETAPYGTAAMVALKDAGLWDGLLGKLVFPQDVAQSFQYASTGSVDACFCALSSALSKEGRVGCYMTLREAPDVVQAACVLKRTVQKDISERFAAFLSSPEALKIKMKYGYR